MTPLHFLSISEARDLLIARKISSTELTQAYLDRISSIDSELNSYITVAADHALRAAESADQDAAIGRWRGPLHGIPIALKDVFKTRGMRTTCHSQLLIDNVPTENAFSVERLTDGGAILVGKLATHEFAFGGPSFDLPFPPARNPWNLDCIPGGSSSGAGAAVAAGLCAGALGTDTSGSIRMPANYCGIVGLKPTYGRVSRRGVYPLSFSMDCVGPMARSVKDCAILLDAIVGYDENDPGSSNHSHLEFSENLQNHASGLRIGIARNWFDGAVDQEVSASIETAITVLKESGARVFDVTLPSLDDLNACGRIILLSEGYSIHSASLRTEPEAYGGFTRDRMRLGAFISAEQYIQAQRMRRSLIGQMKIAMCDCDVVLLANDYAQAPTFEASTDTFPFFGKPYLTMPFSVTGQPALALPCSISRSGLPIGVQLAGRAFDEATLLRVGHAFEMNRGQKEIQPPI